MAGLPSAPKLLEGIRSAKGRVYRSREPGVVYVLTDDEKVAARLLALGGKPFRPPNDDAPDSEPPGAYLRAKGGKREWDIIISTIEVEGEQTIWEAAG